MFYGLFNLITFGNIWDKVVKFREVLVNGVKGAVDNDAIGFFFRDWGKFDDNIFEEPEFVKSDGEDKEDIFCKYFEIIMFGCK